MTGARFQLRGASVSFDGKGALAPIDLTIEPGEAVAVVGPSGSGKTTLLRLCTGAVRPTTGSVEVNGEDLATLDARALRDLRSRLGFVHQDLSLVPNLRVSQNVLAGQLGRQGFLSSVRSVLWPRTVEIDRVHAILERVGIPEKLFQRTDTLSGGQRQRVAVARALYQGPSALLADEPLASLDPARARDTIDLLTRISREEGLTLFMSLHDRELATEFVPRLIGLRAGRVEFDAKASAVSSGQLDDLYRLDATSMMQDGA